MTQFSLGVFGANQLHHRDPIQAYTTQPLGSPVDRPTAMPHDFSSHGLGAAAVTNGVGACND